MEMQEQRDFLEPLPAAMITRYPLDAWRPTSSSADGNTGNGQQQQMSVLTEQIDTSAMSTA
jgi:hypothetical protein